MSKITILLATESHPSADHHYVFANECLDGFVEQALRLPVTIGFDGAPVGVVTEAERTANGVMLTIDLGANEVSERIALIASPAFIATEEDWNAEYTDRVIRVADHPCEREEDGLAGPRADRSLTHPSARCPSAVSPRGGVGPGTNAGETPIRDRRGALAALFDAGVNFADYDEGKGSAIQPEGYDHRNVSIAAVRRLAVDRALAALNEIKA